MKNRPAFPQAHNYESTEPGMTLRDYFAAKALPQVMAVQIKPQDTSGEIYKRMLAVVSYAIADAMLVEREKNQ